MTIYLIGAAVTFAGISVLYAPLEAIFPALLWPLAVPVILLREFGVLP